MNLTVDMPEPPDWRSIADALSIVVRSAGCRCEFERNASGVPVWFPNEGGGIGRKLTHLCSRCAAIAAYTTATEAA